MVIKFEPLKRFIKNNNAECMTSGRPINCLIMHPNGKEEKDI